MTAATSTETVRAAMYLRQSVDKEGKEIKVSTQRRALTELCLQRGWTWTEYVDNDFGASVKMPGSNRRAKKRPAYTQMVEDIKAGRLDAVVARSADRLYRHPREPEDLIDLADDRGLELATIAGQYDLGSPEGRLLARMLGSVARHEMEQKSVRHKWEQKRMAEEDGRPWWPSRPFGFDADPDPVTGRWWTVRRDTSKAIIAVNEIRKHRTEATLLKDAYRKFLAGSSTRSLAKFWNDKGITTPRGNRWTGSAIHQLLAAARNAGLREYAGHLQDKKDSEGRVVGGHVEGTWPAIIDPDTWESAERKLKDPSRRNGGTHARKHLLSGLLRCGVCKGPLSATVNSRGVRQYICQKDGCRKIARAAEKLDAMIIEAVVRRLSREDAVELLRPPVDEVDANALREERKTLEDRLGQLGRDFATAPPAFTKAALTKIQTRLGEISDLLTDPGKARIFEDVIGAKDVRKAFTGLDLGRRRTIVDALMTITVNPVGPKAGKVFNPDAIDVAWKEDL